MRFYILIRVGACILVVLVVLYYFRYFLQPPTVSIQDDPPSAKKNLIFRTIYKHVHLTSKDMVIALVACGLERIQETLTVIKSALILSEEPLNIIVFADNQTRTYFSEKLSDWQVFHPLFRFYILSLSFPLQDTDEWRKLFKSCAAQRLFLPEILSDVDSVLYLDTDTLLLTPVKRIWGHFHQMNSNQMAALAPEHEDSNVGWYNRFARHPFYQPMGVNSGVMLMNLSRMRHFSWYDHVVAVYRQYRLRITWGDQDILNILFSEHSDKLYVYPCRYNFRPDHCMYTNVCRSAMPPPEGDGIAVLHGSRGAFHGTKQAIFSAIYRAFNEYQIGENPNIFYARIDAYVKVAPYVNCGRDISL